MGNKIYIMRAPNARALYICIIMLMIAIVCPLHGQGATASDSIPQTDATILKEVVVEAKEIIKKDDKYIIYPTAANKKKSLEATELVGNLNLPGVFMDKRTDNLTSIKGGGIAYCVNGVQVTDKEFRTIHPNLIKRVEFHTVPSARYGDVDYVIDIYVARPSFGFSGIFSEIQSLDEKNLKGAYRNSLKLNYGKSEFTLFGHYEYEKFDGYSLNQSENLIFTNDSYMHREFQTLPYKMKDQYLNTFASYSYMSDDQFFLAKFIYSGFNTPTTGKTGDLNVLTKTADIENLEHLREYRTEHSWNKRVSANLYYQRKLKSKGLIMLDGVYSFMKAENASEKLYEYQADHSSEIAAYEAYGKKHSVISQLKFDQPIASGNLSAGLKVDWYKSYNDYAGSLESHGRQTRQIYEAYCEWRGKINTLTYSLGVKSKTVSTKNMLSRIKETDVIPNFMVMMNLNRNWSINFSGKLGSTTSKLGNSSTSVIQTGQYTYTAGNSNLKPTLSYDADISLTYFTNSLMSNLDISFNHTDSPLMDDIERIDNTFIRSTINGKYSNRLDVMSSWRMSLFGSKIWLMPRFGYSYSQYSCQNYHTQLHTWWFKGGLNYNLRNFDFSAEYYKEPEVLSYGLTRVKRAQSLVIGVYYNINKVKLSLTGLQPLSRKRTSGRIDTKLYDSMIVTSTTLRPLVSFRLAWSISTGKQGKHIEKKINNDDTDNGLL